MGLTFADFTAEESLPEALANFEQQHGERDVVRRFRYMLRHRDGSTLPGEITSVSVWEDDVFAGVQGTVRGVGEQERLARELAASEERYRFLVENSPDVVFATDRDGHVHLPLGGHRAPDRVHRRPSSRTGTSRPSSTPRRSGSPPTAGRSSSPTRPASRSRSWSSSARTSRTTPVEVHAIGIVRRRRVLRGHPRLHARHLRARAPPARAALVRGALPLSRLVVAGPRLGDRRRRASSCS